MVIKDCLFAIDELNVSRLIKLGTPPENYHLTHQEIITILLGDDLEFYTIGFDEVGIYLLDLEITFSKSSYESNHDDIVDYEVHNVRPINVK